MASIEKEKARKAKRLERAEKRKAKKPAKEDEISRPVFDQETSASGRPLIAFGSYPAFRDGRRMPVRWIVLKEETDRALLISEYSIDMMSYDDKDSVVTWETCSLRNYMNSTMLDDIFSEDEKKLLLTVTNDNPDNELFHSRGGEPSAGGNPTDDVLFLLNRDELGKYFGADHKAGTHASGYACSKANVPEDENQPYWLRGPGMRPNLAVYVKNDGSVEMTGFHVGCKDIAVRPAVWVNTSYPEFSRLKTVSLQSSAEYTGTEDLKNGNNATTRQTPGIVFGSAGIILSVLAFLLKIIFKEFPPAAYLAVTGAGLIAGLVALATGIKCGKKVTIILGVIAVILSLASGGTGYYYFMSGIWDLGKYM